MLKVWVQWISHKLKCFPTEVVLSVQDKKRAHGGVSCRKKWAFGGN